MILLNVCERERVPHRVLLLHGRADSTARKVSVASSFSLVDADVWNDCFKALIRLDSGLNLLRINSDDETATISVDCVEAGVTEECEACLRVFYVVFPDTDGTFLVTDGGDNSVNTAIKRLRLGVELLQSFLAEELRQKFAVRKSFRLWSPKVNDADDVTIFPPSCSGAEFVQLPPKERYWKLVKELLHSPYFAASTKYLLFFSLPLVDWQTAGDCLSTGHVAMVNVHRFLFCWPDDLQEVQKAFANTAAVPAPVLDDSGGRGTIGGCYATTLGVVLHELVHLFDVGHKPTGVMGHDYNNIHLRFIADTNVNVADRNEERLKLKIQISDYQTRHRSRSEDIFDLDEFSLVVLYHHRLFNSSQLEDSSVISYGNRLIQSQHPLVIVELRTRADGMTVFTWNLTDRARTRWMLPDAAIQDRQRLSVFALNTEGAVLLSAL